MFESLTLNQILFGREALSDYCGRLIPQKPIQSHFTVSAMWFAKLAFNCQRLRPATGLLSGFIQLAEPLLMRNNH